MLGRTHIAIGILCALLILPFISVPSKLLFVALAAVGSLLPDVDHKDSKINKLVPVTRMLPKLFRHRGFFHSVFPPVAFLAAGWYFREEFVFYSLAFGYVTHLVSDGLTKMGVNYLHPVSTWHMRGPVETGTLTETFIFLGVIVGIGLNLLM